MYNTGVQACVHTVDDIKTRHYPAWNVRAVMPV